MGISANDDRYCWDAANGSLEYGDTCDPVNGPLANQYVVPFDNSAPDYTETPNGQWLERRVRLFYIDQDDQFRGGYTWNAFTRYIDQEVKAVLFWLVNNESGHPPIVQWFGMDAPSIDKNQDWGAGGKSLYWAAPGLPSNEVCPTNSFFRYEGITNARAQNDGTSGVPANDITAGYVACNYRPGYKGWKVWYPSTFDFITHQGTGLPIRTYMEDSDGNGQVDINATMMLSIIPDGSYGPGVDGLHYGREDALIMGGLEQQLALKWAKLFGFSGYNIEWWMVRAVHNMPDQNDGVFGDDNLTFDVCSGQEYGLSDYDGGGYRTPQGEVFYHVVDPNLTNYEWWPEGTNWQHSPSGPYCYSVEERFQQRPDQSHDRDGNGNPVDFADLPSGW